MLLLIALAGYLAICAALFAFQRSYIYFPPSTPALAAPRTTTLALPGAEVRVSERPRQGPQAVLYFGGNAEDVTASLPQLDEAFPGHALYLMHYRGYLGSSGKPTEQALVADALALFDRAAAEHREIVVIGRSLGSGVAIQLAARRSVARLVLVTPFDSLAALGARQFPYLPVRWLLRDKYESGQYAPAVRAPTLLIAAGNDEIIPAQSTALLLSRFARGVASMRVIDGAGHNSISAYPAYLAYLRDQPASTL
ncbi:alpha/beta hydrolase [Massilia suwonensis]|uniref:Alpha/beta hydrolase n=1 Tax=Massilia suwonensis TaxID=648895 RepID=A0ABW0MFL0_9BURK